nr:MAG TPA: hypothetical protein [Bacteriophage sp.]
MIDAFLMMYQTDCMDCVTQSGQKIVQKSKIGVRKSPCAVVLSIWEIQAISP